jgi:hypothetical protein
LYTIAHIGPITTPANHEVSGFWEKILNPQTKMKEKDIFHRQTQASVKSTAVCSTAAVTSGEAKTNPNTLE